MTEQMFKSQMQDALSVGTAAEELGVARSTVNRAVVEWRLRSVEVHGQRWIHASWLEEYRLASTRKGGDETQRSVAPGPSVAPETQRSVAVEEVETQRSVAPPIYKEAPPVPFSPLGRTAPPAMRNPNVKPRHKEAWGKGKKGEQLQGSEEERVTV